MWWYEGCLLLTMENKQFGEQKIQCILFNLTFEKKILHQEGN